MDTLHLYMILLGCTPKGRHIEQHDIFFGIAPNIKALVPAIIEFWPEAEGDIHIDAWREVNYVDGYAVTVQERLLESIPATTETNKLFFINLGGYKQDEFEEFHYKMIVTGTNNGLAVQQAKQTAFYKHTGFKGAESHVDDKYGIDVDDVYAIEDILPAGIKEKYTIDISTEATDARDMLHLGYFMLHKL
jgi:hypothetical protein